MTAEAKSAWERARSDVEAAYGDDGGLLDALPSLFHLVWFTDRGEFGEDACISGLLGSPFLFEICHDALRILSGAAIAALSDASIGRNDAFLCQMEEVFLVLATCLSHEQDSQLVRSRIDSVIVTLGIGYPRSQLYFLESLSSAWSSNRSHLEVVLLSLLDINTSANEPQVPSDEESPFSFSSLDFLKTVRRVVKLWVAAPSKIGNGNESNPDAEPLLFEIESRLVMLCTPLFHRHEHQLPPNYPSPSCATDEDTPTTNTKVDLSLPTSVLIALEVLLIAISGDRFRGAFRSGKDLSAFEESLAHLVSSMGPCILYASEVFNTAAETESLVADTSLDGLYGSHSTLLVGTSRSAHGREHDPATSVLITRLLLSSMYLATSYSSHGSLFEEESGMTENIAVLQPEEALGDRHGVLKQGVTHCHTLASCIGSARFFSLLFESDEDGFEFLYAALSVYNAFGEELPSELTPSSLFETFLSLILHDVDVLIDLLLSDLTFLAYLLGVLKTLRTSSCLCTESRGALVELHSRVESLWKKGLFPYNPKPLLRRLETAIGLMPVNFTSFKSCASHIVHHREPKE